MQKIFKKLSKMASGLLFLAIISSSLFIAIPPQEARAAINSGDKDLGFYTGEGHGINGIVNTSITDSSGKILVAGNYVYYDNIPTNRIARLNSDFTLDTSFNSGTGANSNIRSIAIDSNGKILIGGNFTSYNGTGRNRIARLNSDGSLDTSFNPGTGANQAIYSIAVDSNGKILIGGDFTSYNGTGRNRIARLNSDGSLDTSFNPGTGANNNLRSLAVDSSNRVVIGGWFTSYNGTARNYIARLNSNGSLDTSFNPGTGADSWVLAITNDSSDKILIGGQFTSYNGNARSRIARLNNDGTLDTSFTPAAPNSSVLSIAVDNNSKIVVGGAFTYWGGKQE